MGVHPTLPMAPCSLMWCSDGEHIEFGLRLMPASCRLHSIHRTPNRCSISAQALMQVVSRPSLPLYLPCIYCACICCSLAS